MEANTILKTLLDPLGAHDVLELELERLRVHSVDVTSDEKRFVT